MANNLRFLISDGVVFQPYDETPPVSWFLESRTGAYTTTRTHNEGKTLLLWERHLRRLNDSSQILFGSSNLEAVIDLVNDSLSLILPLAIREWRAVENEELAVVVMITSGTECGVHIHVSTHMPHVFGHSGGAQLAMVGRGRDLPEAKHSHWVRRRKPLEKFRPPSATELLLSDDGDRILEGSITNFFVVCRKKTSLCSQGYRDDLSVEVYTTPISDGVLPGVIRQLVIEVCLNEGIPVKEVSPSWSDRESWHEAFITNSLKIIQHVEKIQVPVSWESLLDPNVKDVSWEELKFEKAPGPVTAMIQEKVMAKAIIEGIPLETFIGC